jgi:hypothetical protein
VSGDSQGPRSAIPMEEKVVLAVGEDGVCAIMANHLGCNLRNSCQYVQ